MIFDKYARNYTTEDLKIEWINKTHQFKLIQSNYPEFKTVLSKLIRLTEHISDSPYAEYLFPGVEMNELKVSPLTNGNIERNKVIHIYCSENGKGPFVLRVMIDDKKEIEHVYSEACLIHQFLVHTHHIIDLNELINFDSISFDQIIEHVRSLLGSPSELKFTLTPNDIHKAAQSMDITVTQKQIRHWHEVEYINESISPITLIDQTSIDMTDSTGIYVITDCCFPKQQGYIVPCNQLIHFMEVNYPQTHDEDFIQPSDMLFIHPKTKLLSLVHHEGILFEIKTSSN